MVKSIFLFVVLLLRTSTCFGVEKNLYIFTSEFCGPCVQLKNFIFNDQDILEDFNLSIIDILDFPEIAKEFKIKLVPVSIIIIDGKEVGRLTGYGPDYKKKLYKLID